MEFDGEWERALGRAAARPSIPVSMVMWSNYMRAVEDDGVTLDALGDRTRVPVKSLRAMTGGLERWGYVTVDGAGSGRDGFGSGRGIGATSVIGPTAAGTAMRAIWRPLTGTIEARWSERFGSDAIDRLRRALASASEPDDSALPRFVPIVAPTNGFFTVLPDDVHPDDEAPDLPTSLSRALLSYTAEFERESEASLPVFANSVAHARRRGHSAARSARSRGDLEGGSRDDGLASRSGWARDGRTEHESGRAHATRAGCPRVVPGPT